MAKLWEDSLFKKQEVVTSCIKPEYTSVILTLKIHSQPAILKLLESSKAELKKSFPPPPQIQFLFDLFA